MSFGGRFGYDDAGNTANTQVVLHDYPGAPIIFETRGLPRSKAARKDKATWTGAMDKYHGSQVGVVVHCEHGIGCFHEQIRRGEGLRPGRRGN